MLDEAIELYRGHLWSQLKSGDVTLLELAELRDKTLGCYCKPSPCHGDVLARAAEWAAEVLASSLASSPSRVSVNRSKRLG